MKAKIRKKMTHEEMEEKLSKHRELNHDIEELERWCSDSIIQRADIGGRSTLPVLAFDISEAIKGLLGKSFVPVVQKIVLPRLRIELQQLKTELRIR